MAGPLSDARHEKFCQLFVSGKSKIDAHEQAGFARDRYSAHKLSKRPEILARIKELQEGAAERAEITQAMVLAELAKIGFSDIRKAVRWGSQLDEPESEEELEPQAHGGALKRQRANGKAFIDLIGSDDLDDGTAAAIAEVAQTRTGLKVKLHDKRAALVDIGKHLGMFKESVEVTGKGGGPIEVDVPLEEAARRIAFLLSAADRASK